MSALSDINPRKPTLLIVDDDATVRSHLQDVFAGAGFSVQQATDATAALRIVHEERCDLVILDLELPDISGLSLCRLLRSQPGTAQIPIVVISATDSEPQKVEAFAAGANDYIVKPSSKQELLSRVGAHLEAAQRTGVLVGSNRELMFLADLGRGLLRALEPEEVVRRVAGATYEGINATLCGVAVKLHDEGTAVCVFDREGSAEDSTHLHMDRLDSWLSNSASTSPLLLEEKENFFLNDDKHRIEYVAPLCYGGRAQGALIVGFDRPEECSESVRSLVDAAAQQTALAAHISSLYDAARDASIMLATEQQRKFTEAIIDTLPVSLYAIDREYRIVAWNRNRELGGQGIPRDDALGRSIFEILTRQRRDVLEGEFSRAFETGEIERIEQESYDEDGSTKHWLISKVPMRNDEGMITHVITVGEETTDRVQAYRAVARAEKLAAVGRLAAGVVHEINNPLATISACAEALESRVLEGAFDDSAEVADLREYLGLIRSEAFRCKSITNGLLDFSRTRAGQKISVDMARVINSAARLLSHQRRNNEIEIDVDAEENIAHVTGDEGQLQQAVIALSTNAIDAMPDGGRLTLRALNGDSHVVVEVCDTGVGIAPENLSRIFDPFFTTKEVGRGTGLGLAVSYGIVTEHGGRLEVQSTVGVGTVFTITLPTTATTHEGDTSA